jgi:hypothetical protein
MLFSPLPKLLGLAGAAPSTGVGRNGIAPQRGRGLIAGYGPIKGSRSLGNGNQNLRWQRRLHRSSGGYPPDLSGNLSS